MKIKFITIERLEIEAEDENENILLSDFMLGRRISLKESTHPGVGNDSYVLISQVPKRE